MFEDHWLRAVRTERKGAENTCCWVLCNRVRPLQLALDLGRACLTSTARTFEDNYTSHLWREIQSLVGGRPGDAKAVRQGVMVSASVQRTTQGPGVSRGRVGGGGHFCRWPEPGLAPGWGGGQGRGAVRGCTGEVAHREELVEGVPKNLELNRDSCHQCAIHGVPGPLPRDVLIIFSPWSPWVTGLG